MAQRRSAPFRDLESPRKEKGHRPSDREGKLRRCKSKTLLIALGWLLALGVVVLMLHNESGGTTQHRLVERYSVVIDAGSTGSRIHVYTFSVGGKPGEVVLSDELFEHLKPGLSSYAGNPSAAANSLRSLLDKAVAHIPLEARATTRLFLGATAGLRLLQGSQSSDILAAVIVVLQSYPFVVDGVEVMDGSTEAQFAFVALNYLLGVLDSTPASIVDLGGGSVQVAHALDAHYDEHHPLATKYVADVDVPGSKLSLYTHSYLGFGLNAARAKMLRAGGAPACVPFGYMGAMDYEGAKLAVSSAAQAGAASFEKCAAAIAATLSLSAPCGAPAAQCSFDGAWRGGAGRVGGNVHLMSYLVERIEQANAAIFLEGDAAAAPGTEKGIASLQMLESAGRDICSLSFAELGAAKRYAHAFVGAGGSDGADAPFFCADLAFIHVLLARGLGIGEREALTLVKKLSYAGKPVEATWSLGAAIRSLAA